MTNQPERTTERRKTARQKSFLRGAVQFNNRRSVVDCLVRDISPYGARLIFSDAAASIPDMLELHIPQKEMTLRSHIIWRHGKEVGVAFAQTLQMEPAQEPAGELAERVAKLEAEIAGLKRLLRKIKSDVGADFDAA
jgi:hypothetical protein